MNIYILFVASGIICASNENGYVHFQEEVSKMAAVLQSTSYFILKISSKKTTTT